MIKLGCRIESSESVAEVLSSVVKRAIQAYITAGGNTENVITIEINPSPDGGEEESREYHITIS